MFTLWQAEMSHYATNGMDYTRHATDWELLADLAFRLRRTVLVFVSLIFDFFLNRNFNKKRERGNVGGSKVRVSAIARSDIFASRMVEILGHLRGAGSSQHR